MMNYLKDINNKVILLGTILIITFTVPVSIMAEETIDMTNTSETVEAVEEAPVVDTQPQIEETDSEAVVWDE